MKIAIIGAGASGLLLATKLEKLNIDYDLYNDGKVGNKILASGNGKCNISNINLDSKYYHNSKFYPLILKERDNLFSYFNELGIITKTDKEGRMYPYSESSQSVLNCLLSYIKNDIKILKIENIKKQNNKYYLNNLNIAYDKVVLATGSNASLNKMKSNNYNNYLKSLNIDYNGFKSSLCGFKVNNQIKQITGVRAKVNVSLYNDNKLIATEFGEMIFKDDGVSGICIMNLSSYYNHLKTKKNPYILIDLAKDLNVTNLTTVLSPKLLTYVKNNNIDIHNMKLNIIDTYSLEFAQVGIGGISYEEINEDLSLKKDSNIYVIGELLDIDGICGGYNLMSAFCSALVVNRSITK